MNYIFINENGQRVYLCPARKQYKVNDIIRLGHTRSEDIHFVKVIKVTNIKGELQYDCKFIENEPQTTTLNKQSF